jgi:type IV pilus biogenesis protein PilP
MALEKTTEGASIKQKAMIGAVVIVVLIVIWQMFGLMGSGGSSAPPTATAVNQGAKTSNATAASSGMNATSAVNGQTTQQVELKQAQVINDVKFLQSQQASEQKYIGKINDLEDLKIQRAIAETNQAIAAAKLATVTAEKNISDLLTKPATPEVPAGIYANKLTNPTQAETIIVSTTATSTVEYTVISVSMQLGKWNAVLGYQGKLYSVVVGDVLAVDDSVVTSINKNGVVLQKDGKSRKISITSAI